MFNKNNSLYVVMFYPARPDQLGACSQQLDRCNKCDVTESRVRNMSCQGPGGNIRERREHRVIRDRGEEREYDTGGLQCPADGVISVYPSPVINPSLYIGCNVRKRVILCLITVMGQVLGGRPGL